LSLEERNMREREREAWRAEGEAIAKLDSIDEEQ